MDALRQVEQSHTGIPDDPDSILNMDETHIDGEFCEWEKTFGSSKTNYGGITATKRSYGKHLTATIATSASGKIAQPFFIAAGKKRNAELA